MPHSQDSADDSTYPILERPEFKSSIPEHLLKDASASDRYILEQLSILSQSVPWLVEAAMTNNHLIRATNGRLLKAESNISEYKSDKKAFTRGWKGLVIVCTGLSGIVSLLIHIVKAWKAIPN